MEPRDREKEREVAPAPPRPLFPPGAAPQPRDVAMPDFTSDTYVPFAGQISNDITAAANKLVIWAPTGARFVLRGGYVHAWCLATLVGTAAPGSLSLYDEEDDQFVLPLGTYYGNSTASGEIICGRFPFINTGTRYTSLPFEFDLGKGYRSRASENRLLLGGTCPIGVTGTIYCAGMVWGIQVTS